MLAVVPRSPRSRRTRAGAAVGGAGRHVVPRAEPHARGAVAVLRARPGGGVHPDYVFFGKRSTLGARYRGARWGMHGAIQYVRLENLPSGAIGPGLLGTGGAYFYQANGTFSYQFYLRRLGLRVHASARVAPGRGGATLACGGRGASVGRSHHRHAHSRAPERTPAGRHGVVHVPTRVGRRAVAASAQRLARHSDGGRAHAGHLRGVGQPLDDRLRVAAWR